MLRSRNQACRDSRQRRARRFTNAGSRMRIWSRLAKSIAFSVVAIEEFSVAWTTLPFAAVLLPRGALRRSQEIASLHPAGRDAR